MDVVAVASAEPYANHLHFTPCHPNIFSLGFYKPYGLPDAQPTLLVQRQIAKKLAGDWSDWYKADIIRCIAGCQR